MSRRRQNPQLLPTEVMSRTARVVWIGAAVAFAGAVAFGTLHDRPCEVFVPGVDTPELHLAESRELMQAVAKVYAPHRNAVAETMTPAAPRRVLRIHGSTAEIEVAHAMDAGNREYASAWRDVYSRRHGEDRCVTLVLVWPSGGTLRQRCSPNDD